MKFKSLAMALGALLASITSAGAQDTESLPRPHTEVPSEKELLAEALDGNSESMFWLGLALTTGSVEANGFRRDVEAAVDWIAHAAGAGHIQSRIWMAEQRACGAPCTDGKLQRDVARSMKELRALIAEGAEEATWPLITILEGEGSHEAARDVAWNWLVDLDSKNASPKTSTLYGWEMASATDMYRMMLAWEERRYLPSSEGEASIARKWAAWHLRGETAMDKFSRGILTVRGDIFPKDLEAGIMHLESGANTKLNPDNWFDGGGQFQCRFALGEIYLEGRHGVEPDAAKALNWLTAASKIPIHNNGKAEAELGLQYYIGALLPQDGAKAFNYLSDATDLGHNPVASLLLGEMLYYGQNCETNPQRAVEQFQIAHNWGLTFGAYYMGVAHIEGKGALQDYEKARKFFLEVSDAVPGASFYLGNIYRQGLGVPKNLKKSTEWYLKAANAGNSTAQFNVGVAYSEGTGVLQDAVEAYAWFNVSAYNGVPEATRLRERQRASMTSEQVAMGQARSKEILSNLEAGAQSRMQEFLGSNQSR